jgi:hypothetical protein
MRVENWSQDAEAETVAALFYPFEISSPTLLIPSIHETGYMQPLVLGRPFYKTTDGLNRILAIVKGWSNKPVDESANTSVNPPRLCKSAGEHVSPHIHPSTSASAPTISSDTSEPLVYYCRSHTVSINVSTKFRDWKASCNHQAQAT